jgi:general secretion pathway protein A
VTSDDPSRRSLADDPHFLASLSDLDQGITADAEKPPSSRTQPPSAHSAHDARKPRHLSELFPSTPGETVTFPGGGVPQPTPGARRLIPILDSVAEADPVSEDRSEPVRRPVEETRPIEESRPRKAFRKERRSSDRRHAPYEEFYGLREPPFSIDADPRFIFHGQSYDRVAQQVLDAIRQRDGIAILTGEAGVGKTTLCRVVIEQMDHRTLTSFVADPLVTPEMLIRKALVDFGVASTADIRTGRLSNASREDLKSALQDFLFSLAPIGAFAVIIVDEAHSLPEDQLAEVRALAATGGEEQLLQILLVGEPSLLKTLSRSSLRQTFGRVTARAVLGPLPEDEISGYVAHRLQVAGAGPRLEFQPAAIGRLYELSGGNPRLINVLADGALEQGFPRKAKTITRSLLEAAARELDLIPPSPASTLRKMVTFVLFLLLLLVGAAGGAYVYRSEVAALIRQWQAEPMAPAPPRPDLPSAHQPIPLPEGVQ